MALKADSGKTFPYSEPHVPHLLSKDISFEIFKILLNNVIHIHFIDDEIKNHEVNDSNNKFQNWNT